MPKRLTVYNIADLPREARLQRRAHENATRCAPRTPRSSSARSRRSPVDKQRNHREPHDHPYDMLLVVLKGTMMQEVEGVEYKLDAGSATVVPAY